MGDKHDHRCTERLDVNPEDLSTGPRPPEVVSVCCDDGQVHEGQLDQRVTVQLHIEFVLQLQGARESWTIEQTRILESEKLESGEHTHGNYQKLGAWIFPVVLLIPNVKFNDLLSVVRMPETI